MIRLQIGNYTESQREALYKMFVNGLCSLKCEEKKLHRLQIPHRVSRYGSRHRLLGGVQGETGLMPGLREMVAPY